MTNSQGYRGYITSRPIRGQETPHQVQNMVAREYCRKNGHLYLLSATEYSIPNCFMMLTELLNSLDECQGIVLYSQFLLPQKRTARLRVYEQLLTAGAELHAALENTAIRTKADITAFEDTISIVNALPAAPMGGQYDKTIESAEFEAFKLAVL